MNAPDPQPNGVSWTDSISQSSQTSQTAAEFIDDQLRLEADAREVLPYAFDVCTQPLGPLRQSLFSCLTCNPPPSGPTEAYTPAGVCYSCSIACHGEHTLVELFSKRNFVCDCGTTRLPSTSPCSLRINQRTALKGGCRSEGPASENRYDHNFQNRFCSCEIRYDAEKEKGTMYQCLGLGHAEDGGCGEDWWHPACVVGLKPDWDEKAKGKGQDEKRRTQPGDEVDAGHDGEVEDDDPPLPPGFPEDDSFASFICWKCIEVFPWLKRYAGTEGFLKPVFKHEADATREVKTEKPDHSAAEVDNLRGSSSSKSSSRKRKAEDDEEDTTSDSSKKAKVLDNETDKESKLNDEPPPTKPCNYKTLPPAPTGLFSLFLKSDFRDHLCHCPECFPDLARFPQLLEEEDDYQPPLSESGDEAAGGSSVGSLLDRGERALNNVDRVRAIEGVMVYNDLKEKVKAFLKPFAETGQPVGAEDIKQYFEKLRGDAEAVKAANAAAMGDGGDDGDRRREQRGK
ncbi:MAG: hypothetical protein M1816_007770 [Peltula sp. TS41687]|nr:MAG: hypothetical protein M1816_007770 [Peltula sp. TS41687]